MQDERNTNLDIIRIVAFIFVETVHFYTGIAFYLQPINSFPLFILLIIRNIAVSCVPLFLLLSGFLLNRKRFSATYYLGLVRIWVIYIFVSFICLLYKHCCLGQDFGIREVFGSITNFYADDYSFYVSIYTSLFLLAPFINVMYFSLNTKKEKVALIITVSALTVLPSLMNIKIHLFSFYFSELYPIAYYLIGVFLWENRPTIKTKKLVALLVVVVTLFGMLNYFYCNGGVFDWPGFTYYDGIETVIVSTLIFSFILSINIEGISQKRRNALSSIAYSTYSAYLISFIVDDLLYVHMREVIPAVSDRNIFIIVAVPLTAVVSLTLGKLIDRAMNPVIRIVKGFFLGIIEKQTNKIV